MDKKYCPNCGHEVKNGDEFCPNCGAKVTNNMSRSQATNSSVSHQVVQPKSDGVLKGILIALIVVLGVIIVGGGVYLVTSSMMHPKQQTTTKTKKVIEKSNSNDGNSAASNSSSSSDSSDSSSSTSGPIGESEAMDILRNAGYDSSELNDDELVNSSSSMTTINTYYDDGDTWIKNTYTLYPEGNNKVEIHLQSYRGTDKGDAGSFQTQISPTGAAKQTVSR
ncbi:zinc-ribbon domain-containing protein [Fructilactobacillus sp. Tb1]|uniref:zinc-ribbon domain-containing protein n=1 Tax=Fructilactobacillus sp. Tb1 TaxID=3422304 RepID=UPI003D2DEF34